MPGQPFVELVGHLLRSKTHPRILLPPRLIAAEELCRVRQIALRDWIGGDGHRDPSVDVPIPAVEQLLRRERDHGPIGNVDADPERWVEVALRIIQGETVAGFCAKQPKRPDGMEQDPRFIRRQLRDIQRRLAARGVLPWAAFNAGVVPSHWQIDARHKQALAQWRQEAQPIDIMHRVIDSLVAGLATFERTGDRDLAGTVLVSRLRRGE